MKRFVSEKPNNIIDFGAASAQIGQTFKAEIYNLRIESARVVGKQNTSVLLDLIETESGAKVAIQPMWVDGPNANAGGLAVQNKDLIAQLLTLAGQPTVGDVADLIPKLAGLSFEARLVLSTDGRTGRTYNALAKILTGDES